MRALWSDRQNCSLITCLKKLNVSGALSEKAQFAQTISEQPVPTVHPFSCKKTARKSLCKLVFSWVGGCFLGNGRSTVSRVLLRKRELRVLHQKLGEFCENLGAFALAHK